MADFKVGDRVRAKEAIYEPADDHAPGGYVCGKNDLLIVRKVRPTGKWPLSVSHEDVTDNSFSCGLDEVAPDGVEATAPKPTMICPRCKVDRFKEPCPGPYSLCPIRGEAQGPASGVEGRKP